MAGARDSFTRASGEGHELFQTLRIRELPGAVGVPGIGIPGSSVPSETQRVCEGASRKH